MINLETVSNALKNLYLNPLRDDFNLNADPLAARILKTSDNITGYAKIVRAAIVGANGGAGAGTETGALPRAGENLYEQLESDTKNLYGVLEISDKSMKSVTGNNAGSFVNALQKEIERLTKTLKWNLARQIYGDGSGVLTKVKAAGTASAVLECNTGFTTQFLVPGLKVDLHAATDGAVGSGKDGLRVLDVDHKANKIRLSAAVTATAGDYLTIQGSAGYELTGLGKIFEPVTATSMLYGKKRQDYSWMRPYVEAAFGGIDEVKMQSVINLLEDTYNITVNHITCGNSAYGHYMNLLNQRRAINDTMVLEGGHVALKFNNKPVVRSKFLPLDAIDLYDTSLFTLDQIDDWDWIEGPTKGILTQVAGYPIYTATIAKYCDLMCALPGGLARLSGVTAAA